MTKFLLRLFFLSLSLTLFSKLTFSPVLATTTVRFLYDGDGVRVAKIEEGKTTLYVGETEIVRDRDRDRVTRYYIWEEKESLSSKLPILNYQLPIT